MPISRIEWGELLSGRWRVARFYTDSTGHHMLLRQFDTQRILNLYSEYGLFAGFEENDIVTVGLLTTQSLPISRSNEHGYDVNCFIINPANQ